MGREKIFFAAQNCSARRSETRHLAFKHFISTNSIAALCNSHRVARRRAPPLGQFADKSLAIE